MPAHLQTIESIETLLQVECILPEGLAPVTLLKKKSPGVLINLKTIPLLNAIHFALLQRIALLTQNGFMVTVCFYDHTTLHGAYSNEIKTESDCHAAMDWLATVITSYDGVEVSQVEFLMESILWKERALSAAMPGPLIALMRHSSTSISSSATELVGKPLDYYFGVLLGILYEFVIKPDYVLFAGVEAQCWKNVRSRALLSNIYGQDQVPTAILRIPDLMNHRHTQLLSTTDADDPFCTRMNLQQSQQQLASASPQYIAAILAADALFHPLGNVEAVHAAFHRKYDTFIGR